MFHLVLVRSKSMILISQITLTAVHVSPSEGKSVLLISLVKVFHVSPGERKSMFLISHIIALHVSPSERKSVFLIS